MNLRDWLAATGRSWLLVVAAGAVGAACGVAVASSSSSSHTAVSKVAVVANADAVLTAENAQQLTQMVRSELTLYQAMARSMPVAERAAARVPGTTAATLSGATAATGTDQVVVLSITSEDPASAVVWAEAMAEELAVEIEALHPGTPPLVRAEAIELPISTSSSGVSWKLMAAAGAVLGLSVGLTLAWWRAALRPIVGSGQKLVQQGYLVLRAEPDETSLQQLGAILIRALKTDGADAVTLVASGQRVNLGPWRAGLMERIGPHATTVTTAPGGADPVALDAVSDGAVTVLFVDRRDSLTDVEQAAVLLRAAGAQLVAILVVSEPRI